MADNNDTSTSAAPDRVNAAKGADIEMATVPNKQDDPFLVAFAESFDADNLKNWSNTKKWTVTDVLSATGFNRIMVSTIMAPALPTIARELNMSSEEAVMALSTFC